MGIVGEPDAELNDLLGLVDSVQQAAMRAIRPGATGGDIYAGPRKLIADSPLSQQLHFVAHGMGLVSHEAPHLTPEGPVAGPGEAARQVLEASWVLSIERNSAPPRAGFHKARGHGRCDRDRI